MPLMTPNNKRVLFLHIPKTGGSALETYLQARFGQIEGLHQGWTTFWRRQGGWKIADPPNSPQHTVWGDIAKLGFESHDVSFAVVRDPIDRLISEYKYQAGRGVRRAWFTKLGLPIWIAVMLNATTRNPYHHDNHFRLQSDFTGPQTQVFHMDQGLFHIEAWLDEVTGQGFDGPTIPRKPYRHHDDVSRLKSQDLDRILGFYGADYECFGFTMPAPAAPRGLIAEMCIALTGRVLGRFIAWLWVRGQF